MAKKIFPPEDISQNIKRVYNCLLLSKLPVYDCSKCSADDMLAKISNFPGLIFIFEDGEEIKVDETKADRIVFVGYSQDVHIRIRQYVYDIERNATLKRQIGAAMLQRDGYDAGTLDLWWHYRDKNRLRNTAYMKIEEEYVKKVLTYIQGHLHFMPVRMDDVANLESFARKMLATFSWGNFKPSEKWLGNTSPWWQVRDSGLWAMRTHHSKTIMEESDFVLLEKLIKDME